MQTAGVRILIGNASFPLAEMIAIAVYCEPNQASFRHAPWAASPPCSPAESEGIYLR